MIKRILVGFSVPHNLKMPQKVEENLVKNWGKS